MAAPCSSVPANSHRGTLLLSTQWAHDKAEEEWALDEGDGEWEEGEWEEGEWEAEEGIPPRASPAAKPNQHVRFPSSPKHLVAAEDDADAEIPVFDARGVLCERRGDTPARHKHEGRAAKRAREEMEAELARELAEEMEVELDAEMDSEIDSEIEAEIEAEIESDIEAEEEMQAEIEEEIEAEMEAELTHEILGDADALPQSIHGLFRISLGGEEPSPAADPRRGAPPTPAPSRAEAPSRASPRSARGAATPRPSPLATTPFPFPSGPLASASKSAAPRMVSGSFTPMAAHVSALRSANTEARHVVGIFTPREPGSSLGSDKTVCYLAALNTNAEGAAEGAADGSLPQNDLQLLQPCTADGVLLPSSSAKSSRRASTGTLNQLSFEFADEEDGIPAPAQSAQKKRASTGGGSVKKAPRSTKKSPASIKKSPASTKKSPASIKKSPASIKKSPASTKKSPAASTKTSEKKPPSSKPPSARPPSRDASRRASCVSVDALSPFVQLSDEMQELLEPGSVPALNAADLTFGSVRKPVVPWTFGSAAPKAKTPGAAKRATPARVPIVGLDEAAAEQSEEHKEEHDEKGGAEECLSMLPVRELREILKQKGLSTAGKKADLVKRLLEATAEEAAEEAAEEVAVAEPPRSVRKRTQPARPTTGKRTPTSKRTTPEAAEAEETGLGSSKRAVGAAPRSSKRPRKAAEAVTPASRTRPLRSRR